MLSAAPVATAPPPRAASKSEADYLHEQAANAKAAFKQTLGEIFTGLGAGVSPAKWTEEHQLTLDEIIDEMIVRCRELKLRAVGSQRQCPDRRLLEPPPKGPKSIPGDARQRHRRRIHHRVCRGSIQGSFRAEALEETRRSPSRATAGATPRSEWQEDREEGVHGDRGRGIDPRGQRYPHQLS